MGMVLIQSERGLNFVRTSHATLQQNPLQDILHPPLMLAFLCVYNSVELIGNSLQLQCHSMQFSNCKGLLCLMILSYYSIKSTVMKQKI